MIFDIVNTIIYYVDHTIERITIMKKYLLPEGGNFYKANLHCHSNVSDGALSPAELKKIYMEKLQEKICLFFL